MIRRDSQQIQRFATYLQNLSNLTPFNFTDGGSKFPAVNAPFVADTFFFSCLNQFGFWSMENGKWKESMVATLDGQRLKGSDYLFACVKRTWNENPEIFRPCRLAGMCPDRLSQIFLCDNRTNPLPMWNEHAQLSLSYARWMEANNTTPESILEQANQSPRPLQAFLDILSNVPGYKEDPMRKKSMLLGIIMENRPERFLRVSDPQSAIPIIDYHLQRSALRTGLVVLDNPADREKIHRREAVAPKLEEAIRRETYAAMDELTKLSGQPVAAIDWFFFQNRHRCPEMTAPDCPNCPVQDICAQQVELFQPVLRTTFY